MLMIADIGFDPQIEPSFPNHVQSATLFRRNERTDLRTRLGGRECPVGQIEPESLPSWVSETDHS